MSAMTEQRLIQIRAFVDKNSEAGMIAMSRAGMVELLDYIDFLRECIAKAGHAHSCQIGVKFYNSKEEAWGEKECTCWQRQALGCE